MQYAWRFGGGKAQEAGNGSALYPACRLPIFALLRDTSHLTARTEGGKGVGGQAACAAQRHERGAYIGAEGIV